MVEAKSENKIGYYAQIEGGLYHVQNKDGKQIGLVGGAPFSSPGLGYSNSSNMYINTITDDEKRISNYYVNLMTFGK